MKRRILTVALAVLLAVLGTAGVLAYVHQADARALAGQRAVTVLVAGSVIPSGTSAGAAMQEGLLTKQTFPASSVPADAVRSISSQDSGLVMSADVQPGQLLVQPMLVSAVQGATALAIPKGMVAVTVALCMPESVAGYVQAGAEVAVFDTYAHGSLTSQDCNGTHSSSASGAVHTRIVLTRVQVLAVGTAQANAQASATSAQASSGTFAQNGNSASPGPVLVTLAVNQADAERLIQLNETGLPYLALLTSSSQTVFQSAPVTLFQP